MRRLTEAERHGRLWTYNSGCRCQLCSAASQDYRRRRYLADPKSAGEWKQAHPEFEVWSGAKRRCTDPTRHDYANYGGRGIEMRLTYAEFLAEVGSKAIPRLQHRPYRHRWTLRGRQSALGYSRRAKEQPKKQRESAGGQG
jgi:hypothetical protein